MKKIPYKYYKNIVDTLKLRSVLSSNQKRFSAKKFITRELPYRLKQIRAKQPLLFRKLFMFTPPNKPMSMVNKLIKGEFRKHTFFESISGRYNGVNIYIPKNEFKFLLNTRRFTGFVHHLNYYLLHEPKFAGLIKFIPPRILEGKTEEEQNEIILKFIADYDEKRQQEEEAENYETDSQEIAAVVANEFEIEYDKNNVSDDDYMIEDY